MTYFSDFRQDYVAVFQPLLDRVQAVLNNQLSLAYANGKAIKVTWAQRRL